MKKFSVSFLLIQTGIIFIISCIISIAVYAVAGTKNVIMSGLILTVPVMIMIGFIYVCLVNFITGPMAKKTMEKGSREHNFRKTVTLTNQDSFTLGAVVRISEETGKLAYVSFQNPFVFQLIRARNVTNVKAGYLAGPFGLTRYVYFEFYYDRKRVRVPTYTSRQMEVVTSSLVAEGISKAEAFRDALLRAQKVDG